MCIVCTQLIVTGVEDIGSTGKEELGMAMVVAMVVQTAGLVVATTLELGGRGGIAGILKVELGVQVE